MQSNHHSSAYGAGCGRRIVVSAGTAHYTKLGGYDLASVPGDVGLIASCFELLGYERALLDIADDPTASMLRDGFGRLLSAASPDDKLVIYLSGHGEVKQRHYLLTTDSEFDNLAATAFPVEDLMHMVLDSPINQVLIILDTCSAGMAVANATELASRYEREHIWQHRGSNGFLFVASARSKDAAVPGAFASAFVETIANRKMENGGRTQKFLRLDDVVSSINARLRAVGAHQEAIWSAVLITDAGLLPNPQYRPGAPAGLDVETLRRDQFENWFVPSARGAERVAQGWYFTGRERALRELSTWLGASDSGGRAYIVTGRPGVGKSALLGQMVTLADPAMRAAIEASHTHAPPTGQDPAPIDLAINAKGMVTGDLLHSIAASAGGTESGGVMAIIDALRRRDRRFTLIVDSLDEAAEPAQIANALRELIPLRQVFLLVGTRPDEVRPRRDGRRFGGLGPAVVEIDLERDEYFAPADIAHYVERRLLAREDAAVSTPYRNDMETAQKVAMAVARRAGNVFLVAYVVTRNLIADEFPIDTSTAGWEERLPADLGEAFAAYLVRFDELRFRTGLDRQRVCDMLAPLAFSEGAGLSRSRGLWAAVASEIAGSRYTDSDINLLLDHAGAYIIESNELGESVYRLYHQTLTDYLRSASRLSEIEVQRRFVDALVGCIPVESGSAGSPRWSQAPQYVSRFFAAHAAHAQRLDEFVCDPSFLLHAEPTRLMMVMDRVTTPQSALAAEAYQLAVLGSSAVTQRAAQLALAAQQVGSVTLARAVDQLRVSLPWTVAWMKWQHPTPRQGIRAPSITDSRYGAVENLEFADVSGEPALFIVHDKKLSVRTLFGSPLYTVDATDVSSVTVGTFEGCRVAATLHGDYTVRLWRVEDGAPVNHRPLFPLTLDVNPESVLLTTFGDEPVLFAVILPWKTERRARRRDERRSESVEEDPYEPSICAFDLLGRRRFGWNPGKWHAGSFAPPGFRGVTIDFYGNLDEVRPERQPDELQRWDVSINGLQCIRGRGVTFSPILVAAAGKKQFRISADDTDIYILDSRGRRRWAANGAHATPIRAIAARTIGDRLLIASGADDGTIHLWRPTFDTSRAPFPEEHAPGSVRGFSLFGVIQHAGSTVIAASDPKRRSLFIDVHDGTTRGDIEPFPNFVFEGFAKAGKVLFATRRTKTADAYATDLARWYRFGSIPFYSYSRACAIAAALYDKPVVITGDEECFTLWRRSWLGWRRARRFPFDFPRYGWRAFIDSRSSPPLIVVWGDDWRVIVAKLEKRRLQIIYSGSPLGDGSQRFQQQALLSAAATIVDGGLVLALGLSDMVYILPVSIDGASTSPLEIRIGSKVRDLLFASPSRLIVASEPGLMAIDLKCVGSRHRA